MVQNRAQTLGLSPLLHPLCVSSLHTAGCRIQGLEWVWVAQILLESWEVMLWPRLALAGALVQAYLNTGQAPGMQGAMRSTFLPLEEIPERGKEVGSSIS